MKKIVIPSDLAEKVIGYRKRAKRGGLLTPEESQLCLQMFVQFPQWYRETEKCVFNETVPFGSNVKME